MPKAKPQLEATLKERRSAYGSFSDNAAVAQAIKNSMRAHAGWEGLPSTMKEGLDLIALKMSRIVTGDWTHKDNPHDIAGYAKCMEDFLADRSN